MGTGAKEEAGGRTGLLVRAAEGDAAYATLVRLILARWRPAVKYIAPAALMVALLWSGSIHQLKARYSLRSDVFRYQCFATEFWFGTDAGQTLPGQCDAIHATFTQERARLRSSARLPQVAKDLILSNSATNTPFHTLPVEYPILSLVPFSLPLLVPFTPYSLAFGGEMTILALAMYAFFIHLKGWKVGTFFALLMGMGAYGTGIARFDLLPASLTLLALLWAERRRWTPAYLAIAAATLLKYYPMLLLVPLFIFHWHSLPEGRRVRGLAKALGISAGFTAALLALTAAINPMIAYYQVADLRRRPLEVESVGATVVYLGQRFGFPFRQVISFGSDNLESALGAPVSMLLSALLAVGLVILVVRMWRGHYSIRHAFLATLLLILTTGKLFSAQYLIWVLPVVVYVGTLEGFMPLLWLTICTLTSMAYPALFRQPVLGFFRVVAVRNACLVALTAVALFPELWPHSFSPEGDSPALRGERVEDLSDTLLSSSTDGPATELVKSGAGP